ncbi:Asparagine-rich protein [Cyberlindnera fabianii]|uniref:Asparagine-rich protein n=1 Tax=Cyberlindnera fabianii TaxID=36022 RepID=A0A1V2L0L6_CYBFA|nr:Asparagine-rich protein [Cyberlindnera fabianii]
MSDLFVVVHLATTCDEQGVYVTRDSAEVIEIAWRMLDASTLEEVARDSVLIRPVNTPITTACTAITSLTWEHVRNAGTFKDAVSQLDTFIHDRITSKGLDFTFITLNAWDLRVQLPREARDKSVVLPPYLQHARVFDLKQEYSRWQSHHPEALSYSASNLQSIITALEVEFVPESSESQSPAETSGSSTSTSNVTPPPQAVTNSLQHPRRATDEVGLLSAILKALVKKSTPVEDHPDVLTRPFDARADVRAFLAERSKVLHLSNLPSDTTQSELESWFTQYGGRPIAFWTLKTPDQHKPTGSGFAVFASHEEASESLAMNGRALNDKSIEVEPSSARVLDRAQEILTPFLPSKNRPRPGDWTCPSCGFSNFQRRTACFRCSFPAASAAAIQESMYSGNGQSQTNSLNNHVGNNNAGMNNRGNNGGNNHHHHNNNHHHHHHHGNNNQNNNGNNHGGHGNNQRVSSVPFRAGDWKTLMEIENEHN